MYKFLSSLTFWIIIWLLSPQMFIIYARETVLIFLLSISWRYISLLLHPIFCTVYTKNNLSKDFNTLYKNYLNYPKANYYPNINNSLSTSWKICSLKPLSINRKIIEIVIYRIIILMTIVPTIKKCAEPIMEYETFNVRIIIIN